MRGRAESGWHVSTFWGSPGSISTLWSTQHDESFELDDALTRKERKSTEGAIMRTVISKDGAPIAFNRSGEGPSIILVVGTFNDRSTVTPLAPLLANHCTIFTSDRHGRGM